MKLFIGIFLFAAFGIAMADMTAGVSTGYNLHSGRSIDIDAVTGATTNGSTDTTFWDHGAVLGVFLELPLHSLSHGNIAVRPSFDITIPGIFLHGGGTILYRKTSGESSFRGGLGLQWVSDNGEDKKLNYLSGTILAGFDFGDLMGMRLGTEIEVGVACFKGEKITVEGQTIDRRINFLQLKLVISEVF